MIEKKLLSIFPKERIKSRLIDRVAFAPDAGFYYLLPKAVVQPVSEEEISALFTFSQAEKIPLTFRTGGTSLSGQSVTDGILVDLSKFWRKVVIEEDGRHIRVQPGVIGGYANSLLKKHSRKIGPDPASINSAMMGGILSNNSSGMCCGVSKNSYHTTRSIRFMLPSGQVFSTETAGDYERFKNECPVIYSTLQSMREQILQQPELLQKIREKYKIKNTVGYSVNAFIDHEDPLDILAHLLIGAEGTLAFISEAVLETVPDLPFKSTALLYFPGIYEACQAIVPLSNAGAEAVELMDRASLRSVENVPGLPPIIKTLPEGAAALLAEFQGNDPVKVQQQIEAFLSHAGELRLINTPEFTTDPSVQALYWKVRKGMFPAVGAVRGSGTSVILEDIACPVERLGDIIIDLQELFKVHQYTNAIIFGHARDGNIHFVVTQAFNTADEIERYDRFIQEVVALVVNKYNGALKAEHGTGRNMAPFVETEWGSGLYEIMKALKQCIDPHNLLNPGVIINPSSSAHIDNLKEMVEVEPEVDKCIECGFCEHRCPSRNITLTPRQRIVVRRELVKRKKALDIKGYRELFDQYKYDGMDTCAVDGLCATACPVDINTGSLIKRLRTENHSNAANKMALSMAKHFGLVSFFVKTGIKTGNSLNWLLGKNTLRKITGGTKKILPSMPLWSNQLKTGGTDIQKKDAKAEVVYFPACISRVMGGSTDDKPTAMESFASLSYKAGVHFIVPKNAGRSCCGQPFSSKGFTAAFTHMANETVAKLWEASDKGRLPVVMDITSCTHTLQGCRWALNAGNAQYFDGLRIIDSIDYLAEYIVPRITVGQKKENIVLHPVCSLAHMGLENKFVSVAKHFAHNVTVPIQSGCCGMAGDRGFLFPELTASATLPEATEVKQKNYDGYYSTSKTCEIALSEAVGKNYHSLLNLVDECTV